jgi:hypothetical protein
MKKILSSILLVSSMLSAEINLPDILFHSNYSVSKQTTDAQRVDRAYKGYCIYVLYLKNDYVDLKLLHAEHEIKEIANNDNKVIYESCKTALDISLIKPDDFKGTLIQVIKGI